MKATDKLKTIISVLEGYFELDQPFTRKEQNYFKYELESLFKDVSRLEYKLNELKEVLHNETENVSSINA